jgi:hypothetical protein
MTFAIAGLFGALAVAVSLVAAAVLLEVRERRREADFDAEVADLREETLGLPARELSDPVGEGRDAIRLSTAGLSESRPSRAATARRGANPDGETHPR